MDSQTTTPEIEPAQLQPEIPKNDENSGMENPAKNSLGEKIGGVAAQLAEKFNLPFKRGRGRPRKDGLPKKSDVPIYSENSGMERNSPEIKTEIPVDFPAAADSADLSLFRRCLRSTIKGGLALFDKVTKVFAVKAGCEARFVEKAFDECEDKEAVDDFTEALDVWLKKNNIQPKNLETWNLYLAGGRLAAPRVALLAALISEAKKNQAANNREIVHLDKIRELQAELAQLKKAA